MDDLPWETMGETIGNHGETMGNLQQFMARTTWWLIGLPLMIFQVKNPHDLLGLEMAWFATARCLRIINHLSWAARCLCLFLVLIAPAIADHSWFYCCVPVTVGNSQAYQHIPLIVVSYVVTIEPLADVFFGDFHKVGKRRINKCPLNQPECSQLFNFQ